VAITERAECLIDLGRLDFAEAGYTSAIERAETRGDQRDVAVGKGNLGTVYLEQGRYDAALSAHTEARAIFSALNEPRSVATIWHQIGMVHQRARQYRNAEDAYRQSLAISVSEGDRAGQATTLGQLGNLYDAMGRIEASIPFFQQAADIYTELSDLAKEGVARSNIADQFIQLKRYDDARLQLERAIACKALFGHAAEMWKTWELLHRLETAPKRHRSKLCNNTAAAHVARQNTIDAYASYRRDGGVSQSPMPYLYEWVAQAVQSGKTTPVEADLKQTAEDSKTPDWLRLVVDQLLPILHGDRSQELAEDPGLLFCDAVELKLLLERLAESDQARS
jgi:tetratricopeptide (TPR) repeat protein